MRKTIYFIAGLSLLAIAFTFYACRKDKTFENPKTNSTTAWIVTQDDMSIRADNAIRQFKNESARVSGSRPNVPADSIALILDLVTSGYFLNENIIMDDYTDYELTFPIPITGGFTNYTNILNGYQTISTNINTNLSATLSSNKAISFLSITVNYNLDSVGNAEYMPVSAGTFKLSYRISHGNIINVSETAPVGTNVHWWAGNCGQTLMSVRPAWDLIQRLANINRSFLHGLPATNIPGYKVVYKSQPLTTVLGYQTYDATQRYVNAWGKYDLHPSKLWSLIGYDIDYASSERAIICLDANKIDWYTTKTDEIAYDSKFNVNTCIATNYKMKPNNAGAAPHYYDADQHAPPNTPRWDVSYFYSLIITYQKPLVVRDPTQY